MKNTVLIADDYASQRSVSKLYLSDFGFNFVEANDGEEGLNILKERNDIVAVISDYEMPKMDGIELAKNIRTLPGSQKTPVMMVTSRKDSESKALRSGVTKWLHKPYSREQFIEVVNNMISEHYKNKKINILLIDDAALQTSIWSKSLQMSHFDAKNEQICQFEFTEVKNAQEGLNALRTGTYDLIITDYLMPKVDGLRFVKKIKSMDEFKHIPIFIISSDPKICQSVPEGVEKCFNKPFDASEVKLEIKKSLGMG